MKTIVRLETMESLLQFVEAQKIALEDSPLFGRDDDLHLAHNYLWTIESKLLRDLRKLPPEDE
jgi:hypothetical protein